MVREALDLGVSYIDTARGYGTEEIVGRALEGRREAAVISTKASVRSSEGLTDATRLRRDIELSLVQLRTDTIDVFHLHGVAASDYAYCASELIPELLALRDRGAIRHLALSERFPEDIGHDMLQQAANDDCWDVVMVGFNMLNPSARRSVFPQTIGAGVGVEVMFAVRSIFSQPAVLRETITNAVAQGLVDADALDQDDPLGFLVHEGGADSLVEAAYRFARHEPGCQVILTGTGKIEHLRSNVRSINLPLLPDADLARLESLFGHLAIFTGN